MRLDNIVKKFGKDGETSVFDGLCLELADNEITWIMGESGCGKTTLLRIIAGLEDYSGNIAGAKKCSVMFQEDRLFEEQCAVENVCLAGADEALARKYLLMSGLREEDITRPCSKLSGGMKRRTALVRTLLFPKGEMLLLDEPFKGIDSENRLKAAKMIRELRRGRTLIAVTHDISDTQLIEGNVIRF